MMQEIELGQRICEKIKYIFYIDIDWGNCHKDVANKFSLFKRIMKKIYPEDNMLGILKKVITFDTLDIQEIFDMESFYLK